MNQKSQNKLKKQYWISGGVGSGLLGFGLAALVESGFLKHNSNTQTWEWVIAGTLSLILIMSGVNLLFHSFEAKLALKKKKDSKQN